MSIPDIRQARVRRDAICIQGLADPADTVAYWQARSPQERLVALELTRQAVYGYDPSSPPRFQRFLEVARREGG